jgi:4-hydroxybenzoate polyprenyltransferase
MVEPALSPSGLPEHASVPPCLRGESAFRKLELFARDIKISHTVFALPFALLSTFLAAGGMPAPGVLLLFLVCMVTARTVAMAANRLLDARLDALNPRTAGRAIPSGRLSRPFYVTVLAGSAAAFVAAAAGFLRYRNPWPLVLAVPVLLFLCGYPLLKRFTRLCHYYLGAALALAPVCAWVAVTGTLAPPPLWMAAAVLCWTAGFDIIYACQDFRSDVECGVFSVPAKIGVGPALWVARATHGVCVAMLVALGLSSPLLGTLYFVGVAAAVALLAVEHSLVRADDLSKVNLAFFTFNGVISLLIGTLGAIDVWA